MGKNRKRQDEQARRRTRKRRAVGVVLVAVIAVIAGWWLWNTPEASGGTPKLAIDREVVDLGDLPFETPARVVFTLSNAGDGTLRIPDVPRVRAEEGC